jgi:MYXO-CTERM domain-containing protein
MSFRTWTALILASLATFAAPRSADACSPPPPGLTSSTPADGDTYPANAALFFSGFDISLAAVTVTLDGVPASLGAPPAMVPSVATLMATIAPAPKAGQKVVLSGDFCMAPQVCAPKTITFTAGPPDIEAPPVTDAVSFYVYDYADYKASPGDCTTDSDLAYWVQLQTKMAPAAGESPRLYTLDAFSDNSLQNKVSSRSGFLSAQSLKVGIREFAMNLGGKIAPEAFCFRASTIDAAGNAAPGSQLIVCKACRYRTDNIPSLTQPAEPMWTDADLYAPGPCGMATSSSSSSSSGSGGAGGGGGGGGTDSCQGNTCGCQCRAGGEGEGEAAPAFLATLALGAGLAFRARRRRPQR